MMSTADDNNNNDLQCASSGKMISNTKECTPHEQNNIDKITEEFDKVVVLDDKSTCASCGKEGSNDNI